MSVAGFRPGLGRGGITHSLLVSESGACEDVEMGDVAGGVCAGFMQSEGWRERMGLTSALAEGVVTGGEAAWVAMSKCCE